MDKAILAGELPAIRNKSSITTPGAIHSNKESRPPIPDSRLRCKVFGKAL